MNDQLNERLVSLMDYIGSVAKDADAFARAAAEIDRLQRLRAIMAMEEAECQ